MSKLKLWNKFKYYYDKDNIHIKKNNIQKLINLTKNSLKNLKMEHEIKKRNK
jgi:hypothetical protein